jgi:hypothetical protein
MLNDLLLLSGNDIPFQEAQVTIHQPTIKEIAYIGEEAFFIGCELLNFSKDVLSIEDKTNLEDKTNFEVFMSIMRDKKNLAMQKSKISVMMVLTLIFPTYKVNFIKNKIALEQDGGETHFIDSRNFEKFKEILVDIFCLDKRNMGDQNQNYNPQGEQARKIAEKLKKGRVKAAEAKGEQKISIFSRYISILAVGQSKDCNDLLQYTVYQLFDEFERFELKQKFDINLQIKLAGGKIEEEADNWMKDIHSKS